MDERDEEGGREGRWMKGMRGEVRRDGRERKTKR